MITFLKNFFTLDNITIIVILMAISFFIAIFMFLWIGSWKVSGLDFPNHEEICRILALICLVLAVIFSIILAIMYYCFKDAMDISYIKSWFGFTESGIVWF